MNIRWVFLFFLLVFWLLVAGPSIQGMAVGLVAIAFVIWFNRDLLDGVVATKAFRVKNFAILLGFVFSLLWQIVLANIQVAKLVLSPKLPLQPAVVTFNPGLRTDLGKTILANAITLTPGTLTIDVEGDVFTVHALTLAAAQAVVEWPLIDSLRRMEENS
ncbi:MAG: Na+/H+ antiporter subunit E [Bacillota bacterium]|jgi:multicomponent Na+:H+ antiporter subunit E